MQATPVFPEYVTDAHRKIVGIIRDELAEEAHNGFPLVLSLPNSETRGISEYFAGLRVEEQNSLLDSLAQFAVLPFSQDLIAQKNGDLLFHKYTYKQPSYGPAYLVGRPRQNDLKKALVEFLKGEGFDCKKIRSSVFATGTIGGANATIWLHFDPGGLRQFYFGVSEWMKTELVQELAPLSVTWHNMFGAEQIRLSPIITGLSYDQLWTGSPASPCVAAWDLVTIADMQDSVSAFGAQLKRLGSIIERINNLV